jgi:hypothetical protein
MMETAMRTQMQAMVLYKTGKSLLLETREIPRPDTGELLIEVEACAVCRTDLHVVDGDLKDARLSPDMKSSAKSLTSERVLLQRVSNSVSASRGWDTRAGGATIAGTGPRTFATTLYSLGTPVTAGSRRT